VKILIEISTVQYHRLLSAMPQESPVYSILKNGVVVDHSKRSLERKTVEILCELEQARELLEAAKRISPEAAAEIEDGLVTPRRFEP
jgi:hypothetical protein